MLELSIMNHGTRFIEKVRALLAQFEKDTRSEVNLRVLEWRDAWAERVKVALFNVDDQLNAAAQRLNSTLTYYKCG